MWEREDTHLLSCTVVTTEAAPEFKPWHSRMPVMLAGEELTRWMDNNRELSTTDPLFRPELKYPLQLSPLSKVAGNAKHKDAQVMEPIGPSVELTPGSVS